MRMNVHFQTSIRALSITTLLLFLPALAGGQAPPISAPTSSLAFTVSNGNCLPQVVTASAGFTAITVKMSSTSPQHIALSTTGSDTKHLFGHDQAGTAEQWRTMINLPAGSYELASSLNGNKCLVTVN